MNTASAIYMNAGTITVESSDILPGQSDNTRVDYNFRFKYYQNITNIDESYGKYCINDSSNLVFSGYSSAIYSQSNTSVLEVLYYPVAPTSINTASWVIWHFDFSEAGSEYDTIDQLQVKMRSNTYNSGIAGSSIQWQVSTDGTLWNDVFTVSNGTFNAAFWNLTEYTKGSSQYFLKATLYSTKNLSDAVLFRQSDFGLDNQVWLVPEPATFFLLLGGIISGSLIRRKYQILHKTGNNNAR